MVPAIDAGYCDDVSSSDGDVTPEIAGPNAGSDGGDAAWVDNFLRVLPGKTFPIGSDEHGRDEAARESLGSAASEFVDEVVRSAATEDGATGGVG